MPSWYDPKALTETLELDYVDRPRPLGLWLRRGIWSAGALALLCVAWMLWPSHHTALQAGPLSTPHAMFNQDCGKCHTEAFATATRLMPGEHGYYSTPDQACLQCHPAPDHNRDVKADRCATCHKEHRGHQLLARPSDRHCTNCHATLTEKYGSQRQFENAASFAAHPEFALWRNNKADPGNVEFDHNKHLQLRAEDNLTPIKSQVEMLQQQKCAYCHQPDAAGKYMQPIQYDNHCGACHPLLIRAEMTQVPEQLQAAILAFHKEPVAHPRKEQTAFHVRALVRERYLRFAQNHGARLKLEAVPRQEWMVLPGLPRTGEPASETQMAWVNDQWKQAEKLLFNMSAGCALCHVELSKKDLREGGLPNFGKPEIPKRWLKHAVFDHHAHRMHDCTSCHERALTSTKRQDVLMPKLAKCQTCHQEQKGFARAGCAECHLFHHRAQR